jgi:hypothetical protein
MRPSTRMVVLGNRPLWTPGNISTALWLDANDASTITLNGSTVSQWRDKSGNNRHASQATVANQPTYTANGLNGKSVVTFDGVNDLMSLSSPYISSSGISSIAVLRLSNVTGGTQIYEGINIIGSWVGDFIQDFSLGVRQSSVSVYAEKGGGHTEARAGTVSVNENIIVYGHASSLNTAASLNGGNLSLAGTARNDLRVFGIGKDPDNGSFFYFGIAAEIVLINGVLSTDRQKLEGYLAWKWGLQSNLPTDHPFKFTPPMAN